ncbi:Blue copper protein [Quillaja saponaria]|uniref:Blue copper protein n=1 Tax=Quillaja saponaria TaxID=32244 RepID=A0AAD7VKE7_QUISA|nr:Blue copper protein [Quillaja saponaria]
MNTSPAKFTLNQTGEYYFTCTYRTHCSNGQKLTIEVLALPLHQEKRLPETLLLHQKDFPLVHRLPMKHHPLLELLRLHQRAHHRLILLLSLLFS